MTSSPRRNSPDRALIKVRDFLLHKPGLPHVIGRALRRSFDEVIDGPRTGRYCIEQLEKTEKIYIGTKVEIVLRTELELERGLVLDNYIADEEVDTKFSLRGKWMIPPEAVGKICLLAMGDDNTRQYKLGLFRAARRLLNKGANQDRKKSVSAAGKNKIVWLAQGAIPANFMLGLSCDARDAIMSAANGKSRIQELFRHATGRLIPRYVIEQVARQRDPLKRAREAKADLAAEGIRVLCAAYKADRKAFSQHGFVHFDNDDWLSVPEP